MTTPEAELTASAADVEFATLSQEAVATVRRAFIDTVGVTLAGANADAGRRACRRAGFDPTEASLAAVLGIGTDDPSTEVALRLGTIGHALDYDDLSWGMDGHPSVTLVPAIIAAAGGVDSRPTGRELVSAYVAGFETMCSIAAPVSPEHYEAGWHATATFGVFGAAVAATRVLGGTREDLRRALTVAASTPAGLKRNFGSMTKPLHAGLAARSGVTAAELAVDGFTADQGVISGDGGFWDVYGPSDASEFELPAEPRLETHGIHIKAYPCCYFTHSAIAAAQDLVNEYGLESGDVDRVRVEAAPGAGDALPHSDPTTGLEAKFSMEYAVASGFVRDRVGLDAFTEEAIRDPAVQRVRERVDLRVDPDLAYDDHGATVRVETNEGTFERRRGSPPWTHGNPPDEDALRGKFTSCAERLLPRDRADALFETLTDFEGLSDPLGAIAGSDHAPARLDD